MNDLNLIKDLEDKIEYKFSNVMFLKTALSHSSYSNEVKVSKVENYERQEFLGDAVLELTVSEYIFANNPSMSEGNMTKLRASLVCEPTLAFIAKDELDLPKYILLGKGEDNTGGRNRDSIISDVFEAIIGAIYLDGGIEPAKRFISKYVLTDMERKIEFVDSKTRLQEIVQGVGATLAYELAGEDGPAHDKVYTVRAIINGEVMGEGSGKTKKSAEQHAAYAALARY